MEPCYTLHHHGTKRSLDPVMSSERSSVAVERGGWLSGGVWSLFFSGEGEEPGRTVQGALSPRFLVRGKSLRVVRREVIMRPRSDPPPLLLLPNKASSVQEPSTDMLSLSSCHSPNCWIRNFHLAIKSWMGSSLYWLFKCEGLYAFKGS